MHGQMKISVDNRQDYPCETFLKEMILKTLLVWLSYITVMDLQFLLWIFEKTSIERSLQCILLLVKNILFN